jgi:7-keto-8-aminopelargonate synthetase-like enzyme
MLPVIEQIHREARSRGTSFRVCDNERIEGPTLRLDGGDRVSFASCSYLGLEFHPDVVEGCVDAARRYGTQFASSRAYVSPRIYQELQDALCGIFDAPTLMVPSTTLGHQIALPVLATEKDAILLDNQAHRSVHIGATLARAGGATLETIAHRDLDDRLLETLQRLSREHDTVWFAIDGVYSMYGDVAPVGLLRQALDVAPNVRLYVDDAHGLSWAGEHGRGHFLSRMPMSSRMVLATSFAKGFGAGGGCLVFPDQAELERVQMTGGPYFFSGPTQPPMMGAALGSARVHLSPEIVGLQRALAERVQLFNALMHEFDLPLLSTNESPIFFLKIGSQEAMFDIARRVEEDGFYINVSHFPAVPAKRAGLRLAITTMHSKEQIRGVAQSLARRIPEAFRAHGIVREELDALYHRAVPRESWGDRTSAVRQAAGALQG